MPSQRSSRPQRAEPGLAGDRPHRGRDHRHPGGPATLALASLALLLAASPRPAPAATPCPAQVLAPGQEPLVERLLAPPPLPIAVQLAAPDIAIRASEILATYDGRLLGHETRFEIAIRPLDAAYPTRGLRMERRRPCPEGIDAERQAAMCRDEETQGALAALAEAFGQRLQARGGELRWRCATRGGEPGAPGSLGEKLREVDRLLAVADRQGARQRVDELLAGLRDRRLQVHEEIDLAALLQKVGMRDEAMRRYERALERWRRDGMADLPPEEIDVTVEERVVAALVAVGETGEARERLERCWAEVRAPRTCRSIPAALALESLGDPKTGAEWLDADLAREATPTKALFMARIGMATRHEEGEEELRLARRAAARWPRDPEVIDALATACFRAGLHREAIGLFERVYRLDPKWPGTLGRLSGAFNQMAGLAGTPGHPLGDWQALRDEMVRRAEKDPSDVVAVFTKAVALYYDGELEEAIETMKRVEARLQNEARVFIYQGMAHFWLGRQGPAERLIERAREANPHDSDVYYCYAQVMHKKDRKGAIESLRRYIAMSEAPGALRFEKKTERVKKELAILEGGEDLPDWDRPHRRGGGGERGGEGRGGDGQGASIPATWWIALAALLAGGLILFRRLR